MTSARSAAAWLLFTATAAIAADPLYLEQPFDEIKLDENNNGVVLRVRPLALPGRRMPPPADRRDELDVELVDRPGEKFKVAWPAIVEIRFYEQMVLAEAEQHVRAEKFDEALAYFQFLEAKFPKTPGLRQLLENFLYAQVGSLFRAARYEEALAVAAELYRVNRERQGLATAYERITQQLAAKRMAEGNYRAARGLSAALAARFPATRDTAVVPLEAQLQAKAAELLTSARADFEAGKLREAREASGRVLEIWPNSEGGRELARAIHDAYPVVHVGVTSTVAAARTLLPFGDWAAARAARLLGGDGAGPYTLAGAAGGEIRFVRQAGAAGEATAGLPREIIERSFADSAAAIRALKRGEISAVDRVSPWDIARLTGNQEIIVQPYATPVVHLLVPNPRRALTADRMLRRAILSALDRESILRRGLLNGQTIAGCQVLSGPFSAASAESPARPYDPGLALALVKLALDSQQAAKDASQPVLQLVLAHPPEPIARIACQSIARQLEAAGLRIALREQPAGQPVGDADLRFVELVGGDPAVLAPLLLGPKGIVEDASPALLAESRRLARASGDEEKAACVQAIERLAAAELPIIPLWRLVPHAAYHKSLAGIGEGPESLYQNVDQWRAELRLASE